MLCSMALFYSPQFLGLKSLVSKVAHAVALPLEGLKREALFAEMFPSIQGEECCGLARWAQREHLSMSAEFAGGSRAVVETNPLGPHALRNLRDRLDWTLPTGFCMEYSYRGAKPPGIYGYEIFSSSDLSLRLFLSGAIEQKPSRFGFYPVAQRSQSVVSLDPAPPEFLCPLGRDLDEWLVLDSRPIVTRGVESVSVSFKPNGASFLSFPLTPSASQSLLAFQRHNPRKEIALVFGKRAYLSGALKKGPIRSSPGFYVHTDLGLEVSVGSLENHLRLRSILSFAMRPVVAWKASFSTFQARYAHSRWQRVQKLLLGTTVLSSLWIVARSPTCFRALFAFLLSRLLLFASAVFLGTPVGSMHCLGYLLDTGNSASRVPRWIAPGSKENSVWNFLTSSGNHLSVLGLLVLWLTFPGDLFVGAATFLWGGVLTRISCGAVQRE